MSLLMKRFLMNSLMRCLLKSLSIKRLLINQFIDELIRIYHSRCLSTIKFVTRFLFFRVLILQRLYNKRCFFISFFILSCFLRKVSIDFVLFSIFKKTFILRQQFVFVISNCSFFASLWKIISNVSNVCVAIVFVLILHERTWNVRKKNWNSNFCWLKIFFLEF